MKETVIYRTLQRKLKDKNISVNSGALEICFINRGGHCLGDRNLYLNLSSVSDEE